MGIGKSFTGSMHEGNMGHLNDPYYPDYLKEGNYGVILASAFKMGHN